MLLPDDQPPPGEPTDLAQAIARLTSEAEREYRMAAALRETAKALKRRGHPEAEAVFRNANVVKQRADDLRLVIEAASKLAQIARLAPVAVVKAPALDDETQEDRDRDNEESWFFDMDGKP